MLYLHFSLDEIPDFNAWGEYGLITKKNKYNHTPIYNNQVIHILIDIYISKCLYIRPVSYNKMSMFGFNYNTLGGEIES